MKKEKVVISSPEELNKHLQHTSPGTWIVLSLVIAILLGFFVWSFIYKITYKLFCTAQVSSNEVTLNIDAKDLSKLAKNQKVVISGKEGKILSINDEGQPIVSNFTLADGEYKNCYVVIREVKPVDFLIGK